MTTELHLPLVRFQGLKLACSWKCPARCGHCAVAAGPHRTQKLDADLALACIEDAAAFGLSALEVTGGEAFLFQSDLARFLARASELGLTTTVDTNAFWARTPDAAYDRLRSLKNSGLNRLVVSTDAWHQRFIPLRRVLAAIDAARTLKIECSAVVCVSAGDSALLDTISLLRASGIAVQLQRVAPFGRAVALDASRMMKCSYDAAASPCYAARFPTVGPDGRVSLCCAPPLSFCEAVAAFSPLILGWLGERPLRGILLRAQRDPLLRLLTANGLDALVDRLSDSACAHALRLQSYYGRCDLCTRLLTSSPTVDRLRGACVRPSRDVCVESAL